MELQEKIGRPRRYTLKPPAGFANRELAHIVAQLQEMAERVYDQIVDLPVEALDFTTLDIPLSITMLVLHLGWAETTWVQRLTGRRIPESLRKEIEKGSLGKIGEPPPTGCTASRLIELCQAVQRDYSQGALSKVVDIDEVINQEGRVFSVRGVAAQLVWHWIYHSGQIGLLRLLWGSDYQWRSEDIVALPPR